MANIQPDMTDFGKVYEAEVTRIRESQDEETDKSLLLAILEHTDLRVFCYEVAKEMTARNLK